MKFLIEVETVTFAIVPIILKTKPFLNWGIYLLLPKLGLCIVMKQTRSIYYEIQSDNIIVFQIPFQSITVHSVCLISIH